MHFPSRNFSKYYFEMHHSKICTLCVRHAFYKVPKLSYDAQKCLKKWHFSRFMPKSSIFDEGPVFEWNVRQNPKSTKSGQISSEIGGPQKWPQKCAKRGGPADPIDHFLSPLSVLISPTLRDVRTSLPRVFFFAFFSFPTFFDLGAFFNALSHYSRLFPKIHFQSYALPRLIPGIPVFDGRFQPREFFKSRPKGG